MEGATADGDDKIEVLPTTESDAPVQATEGESEVTEEQWAGMRSVIDYLYDYRDDDDHDPSRVFHKRVNRRNLPHYYDTIKEPMAMSNLKANCTTREYKSFKDFVRDCALIWHNAFIFNLPTAGAYQDAITIKRLMEEQFQKLVDQKLIDEETATWPDLGEIPPVEDVAADEEEEDEEDAEGEEEDDEDVDDSEEDVPRKRKGRPSTSRKDTKEEAGTQKRRGRPPKVDTPMEARIKNVLKGIRKPKNDQGTIMIHDFEKLPDKAKFSEYYAEIKSPISIEQIKKNQKRKRYKSVDHFMRDIDLMFENAKLFNEDDSQIYKAAVHLQKEAHKIAEAEKLKSDDEFVMEEGRKPRPGGITHNGELWKVGDWVHIRNQNDISKPIVAQLYRTWEDPNGNEWVNACWYYRPEQTVHQHEKHFYSQEVVKTGQYRDHPIEDVIGRCFVMFFTRYSRGRPRGLHPDIEVYVCEARYNEEKFKMNKIKTWASCLPDEVRDQDYEMDMYDNQKKDKKVPSPLLHTLKEDVKQNDVLPRWGAENAPPIVGGVYRGPRDENQSPPPEPTPSPPPQPPPSAPRQPTQTPNQDMSFELAQKYLRQAGSAFGPPPDSQTNAQQQQVSYTLQPRQHSHAAPSPTPQQQNQPHQQPNAYAAQPSQASSYQPTMSNSYDNSYGSPQSTRYPSQSQNYPAVNAPLPNGQRPADVFTLPPAANTAIPKEVRDQMRTDENGNVLFFNKPPLDVLPPMSEGDAIGHSIQYRARKIKRRLLQEMAAKEKAQAAEEADRAAKRAKLNAEPEDENEVMDREFRKLFGMSMWTWIEDHQRTTDMMYKRMYDVLDGPGAWGKRGQFEVARRMLANLEEGERQSEGREDAQRKRKDKIDEEQRYLFKEPKVYLDDVDPRLR